MTGKYEVHTWTLCEGWVNCWMVTEEKGNERPDTYPTIEAAQAEIDELFEDIENQIKSGERDRRMMVLTVRTIEFTTGKIMNM